MMMVVMSAPPCAAGVLSACWRWLLYIYEAFGPVVPRCSHGLVVSLQAFQACDPGSIPGGGTFGVWGLRTRATCFPPTSSLCTGKSL